MPTNSNPQSRASDLTIEFCTGWGRLIARLIACPHCPKPTNLLVRMRKYLILQGAVLRNREVCRTSLFCRFGRRLLRRRRGLWIPERRINRRNLGRRITQLRHVAGDRNFRGEGVIGQTLLVLLIPVRAESLGQRRRAIHVTQRAERSGDVVRGSLQTHCRLRYKPGLFLTALCTGVPDHFDLILVFQSAARTNPYRHHVKESRLAEYAGGVGGIGGYVRAQVRPSAPHLAPGAHYRVVEILEHLLGRRLSTRLGDGAHEEIHAFLYVTVTAA